MQQYRDGLLIFNFESSFVDYLFLLTHRCVCGTR